MPTPDDFQIMRWILLWLLGCGAAGIFWAGLRLRFPVIWFICIPPLVGCMVLLGRH